MARQNKTDRKAGRPPVVFATLVPLLAFQLPMIPALYALESGIYSTEIGEAGTPIGSVSLFATYLAVALAAFLVVLAIAPHRAPPMPGISYTQPANVLSVAMLLFYCIPLLIYRPPYLTGMTRYDFVQLPFVSIFNLKLYLAIICAYHGWMFALTRRYWHLGYFLAVVAVMIGWGEKFSGPAYAITFFITGLALTGGFVKKLFIAGAIFVPIILAIWALPTYLEDRSDELIDAFANRIARQGQVFYKVIDEPPYGGTARTLPELLNYSGAYTPEDNGMPYLKNLYITRELAELHDGSFAAGYPAVILTTGLGSGFVVVFLLEVLRFLLMREVLIVGFAVQRLYLVPVYIYFLTYIGKIYESGNTYLLTSPVFFAMLLIVVVGNRLKLVGKTQVEAMRPSRLNPA